MTDGLETVLLIMSGAWKPSLPSLSFHPPHPSFPRQSPPVLFLYLPAQNERRAPARLPARPLALPDGAHQVRTNHVYKAVVVIRL